MPALHNSSLRNLLAQFCLLPIDHSDIIELARIIADRYEECGAPNGDEIRCCIDMLEAEMKKGIFVPPRDALEGWHVYPEYNDRHTTSEHDAGVRVWRGVNGGRVRRTTKDTVWLSAQYMLLRMGIITDGAIKPDFYIQNEHHDRAWKLNRETGQWDTLGIQWRAESDPRIDFDYAPDEAAEDLNWPRRGKSAYD